MDIVFIEEKHTPLYRTLYTQIRGLIQSGAIHEGTKLPSIRALSEQLHLSKTTIETAYQMLLEEGYVRSKPRSGLFVIHTSPVQTSHKKDASPIQTEENQSKYASTRSIQNEHIFDFSLLTVDGDSFPVRAWRSALNEALVVNMNAIHQYGDSRGEYGLRAALCHYLKSSRGVSCSPGQIIIGTGISYSIQIMSKLLKSSSTIAVEEAGIAQVRGIFREHGFNVTPIPMNNNEQMINELNINNINVIYVTPSHRPAGSPLPYSTRQQLLTWAEQNDAIIFEDDYDGEFRYSGRTIPSLQGLDQQGVVMYVGTFSKVFTPALRMNYIVIPEKWLEKLHAIEHTLSSPSRIDQWAVQLFIERGHWARHIRRMRIVYRKKYEKLINLLHTHLSDHVQINGEGAGLHLEIIVRASCKAEELIRLAASAGVQIYGSQDAATDQNEFPKLYLGFGGIKDSDMERGILLLSKAWSNVLLQ